MATLSNAEILRSAAEMVRRFGWQTGEWGIMGSPMCLEGALEAGYVYASCGYPFYDGTSFNSRLDRVAALHPLQRLVAARVGGSIWRWNDRWDDKLRRVRSADQIIRVLEDLAFDEDLKAAATPVDTTIPVAVQIPQLVEA